SPKRVSRVMCGGRSRSGDVAGRSSAREAVARARAKAAHSALRAFMVGSGYVVRWAVRPHRDTAPGGSPQSRTHPPRTGGPTPRGRDPRRLGSLGAAPADVGLTPASPSTPPRGGWGRARRAKLPGARRPLHANLRLPTALANSREVHRFPAGGGFPGRP